MKTCCFNEDYTHGNFKHNNSKLSPLDQKAHTLRRNKYIWMGTHNRCIAALCYNAFCQHLANRQILQWLGSWGPGIYSFYATIFAPTWWWCVYKLIHTLSTHFIICFLTACLVIFMILLCHIGYLLYNQRVVQMIVMHHVLKFFIHTWHMHGYRFAVVKVVYPPRDPQTDLVMTTCMYTRLNTVLSQ